MCGFKWISAIVLTVFVWVCPVLEGAIGVVVGLEGEAQTERNGEVVPLAMESEINLHDKVTTKGGAKLQIQFNDDTLLSLGENSEVVMDEYVYDPANAGESRFNANLGEGLFRLITGKITEINPERFKLKTSRSTIGIRGTVVGVENRGNVNRVMLIKITPGRSISITPQGSDAGRNFNQAGRQFSVDDDNSVSDNPLDQNDIDNLNNATRPPNGVDNPRGGNGNGNNDNNGDQGDEGDADDENGNDDETGGVGEGGQTMSQGQLALILAQKLLPNFTVGMTEDEAIAALLSLGYAPEGGWDKSKNLTEGALALLLAQILELEFEPGNEASALEACLLEGVDFTDIETALKTARVMEQNEAIITHVTAEQFYDPIYRPFLPNDGSLLYDSSGPNQIRLDRPFVLTPN